MAIIVEKIERICIVCEKKFLIAPFLVKRNRTTCSSECSSKRNWSGENNAFFGKKHSQKTKEKISIGNSKEKISLICGCGCGKEIKVSPCKLKENPQNLHFLNREHYFSFYKGKNHPAWRGGVSKSGRGRGWTTVAQIVRDRDKVCQHCERTPAEDGKALNVHHIIPWRVSFDNSLSNLTTLCNHCHILETHKELKNYPDYYSIPIKLVNCLECGKEFETDNCLKKICSEECKKIRNYRGCLNYIKENHEQVKAKRRKAPRQLTCIECGKEFQAETARSNRSKVCSENCRKVHRARQQRDRNELAKMEKT